MLLLGKIRPKDAEVEQLSRVSKIVFFFLICNASNAHLKLNYKDVMYFASEISAFDISINTVKLSRTTV